MTRTTPEQRAFLSGACTVCEKHREATGRGEVRVAPEYLRALLADAEALAEVRAAVPAYTFADAWAKKEALGYQYGGDALENLRFGWEIATAEYETEVVKLHGKLGDAEGQIDSLRRQLDEMREGRDWQQRLRSELGERLGAELARLRQLCGEARDRLQVCWCDECAALGARLRAAAKGDNDDG